MKYYLGPWVWDDKDPSLTGWKPPKGTVGCVDLRSLPEQSLAKIASGSGFFATEEILGIEYLLLGEGDAKILEVKDSIKDAWQLKTGYRPNGVMLVDLLFDQITNGSDATGELTVKSLMPTLDNVLELHLGGHSLVKSEKFEYGVHPHTLKVREVLTLELKKTWDSGQRTLAQKFLGALVFEKFKGADFKDFIHHSIKDRDFTPIKPETTITESFNKADSSTLGPDLSWTEYANAFSGGASSVADTWQVVSNTARANVDATNIQIARAESDLSSSDHYCFLTLAEISQTNPQLGPITRFENGGNNNNMYIHRAIKVLTQVDVSKLVNGTLTQLGSASQTPINGGIAKGQANGSTIKTFYDGTELVSVTDTSISANTRCGIMAYGSLTEVPAVDVFQASDLNATLTTRTLNLTLLGVG